MSTGQVNYLDAFMRSAQYLAGLTTHQDVWSETGKLLVRFWGADLGCFGVRNPEGEIVIRDSEFSTGSFQRIDFASQVQNDIAEVLDSGFLTWRSISSSPEAFVVAFLPITQKNRVTRVLVVGHIGSELLPKDLLNTYLALAGLVGTTAERLASEVRDKERTAELAKTNTELERQIAERHRAEQSVTSERQRLYDILETLPIMVCLLTPDHRVIFCNRLFRKQFGEHNGRRCFDFIFGQDEPCKFCESYHVLETGRPHQWECTTPDGGSVLDVHAIPFADVDGSLLILEMYIDLTEQKRARAVIEAERQQFYEVMETLPVFLVLLTPDHRVTFANRLFRDRFGGSKDKYCFEHLFNRTEPCETCDAYTVLETVAPRQWEWVGPDNRVYEIHAFPFTDTGGTIFVLKIGIDITERKVAENELKQTLADLTRSNEDLQQFAYVASHDLQEPLRNVTTCLQILEQRYKHRLDDKADEYIQYAVEGAVRMRALIQDLLTYSRVATRGKPRKGTDCTEIVDRAIKNLRSAIAETGATVTRDPLPTVRADDSQLWQVFQNLIQNAIKFRGNEPPQVHVSAVKNNNEWIFSVQDNGIGIEPQYLDRIFVIFQRLHKRSQYDGTGMGLAIVKKVVERHGGRVWVNSQPGEGTTFYFTIPEKGMRT